MRVRLVSTDYIFETGRALLLPEEPWLWLDAIGRDPGVLRDDEIEWIGPPRTSRFWIILHDALARRRSDGVELQFEALPLPWRVTITEQDAIRGEAELPMVLGACFTITQVDRQGIPVPNSEISYAPASLPREIVGQGNWVGGLGIRTGARGSARVFHPGLFRFFPQPGCTLIIEPDPG